MAYSTSPNLPPAPALRASWVEGSRGVRHLMRFAIALALVSTGIAACASWTINRTIEAHGSVLGKKALDARDECLWARE
jgi:hypothetical protein